MPRDSFTQSFLQGIQQGTQERQQEEKMAADEEYRKFQIDTLKHQQKALELQGKLEQFKAQQEAQAQALQPQIDKASQNLNLQRIVNAIRGNAQNQEVQHPRVDYTEQFRQPIQFQLQREITPEEAEGTPYDAQPGMSVEQSILDIVRQRQAQEQAAIDAESQKSYAKEAGTIEAQRRLGKAATVGGSLVNPFTGKVLYESPQDQGALPPSYKEFLLRQQNPEFAAFLDRKNNDRIEAETVPLDSDSQAILEQTGLTENAFRHGIGMTTQLPRDQKTRNKAAKEWQNFVTKNNIDSTTFATQYKARTEVLAENIDRLENTLVFEKELVGTFQNLKDVVNEDEMGSLVPQNLIDVWAGQKVNDPLAYRYAFHLSQLRAELMRYFSATQGRSGNEMTLEDRKDSENVIVYGLSLGGLNGLETAVSEATKKMKPILENTVNRQGRKIWELFGIGDKYDQTHGITPKADEIGTPEKGSLGPNPFRKQ